MTETMKTHSLVAPTKFGRDELAKPQESELAEGEVLLKVLAGGVCGSDLPYFRGIVGKMAGSGSAPEPPNPGFISKPGSPMHETLGEVVATRSPHHKVGDKVVGWALSYEGLRPYIKVPGDAVLSYDQQWSPDVAINLQPLACVIYAVERIPDVAGKRVAVLGQGPIGVMFSRLMKEAGAAHVTGIDLVDHSEAAKTFGVDEFIRTHSTTWSRQVSDADRPDIVIEAVGHQTLTLNDAVHGVAHGGFVFAFGVPDQDSYPFDFDEFLHKDLTLRSGLTRDKHRMLKAADDYLRADPTLANNLTTHKFSFDELDEVQAAYETANVPATGRLKVVLHR
ncbi:zinc-binding dehydrogenase [Mariniluteicoccus endophyticus]